MIHQLLDDFEEKLASFTSSALFLFKTSRFFFGENSTSATLSTSTRPFEIEKPHSTKYGVASFGMMCDVHVCNESFKDALKSDQDHVFNTMFCKYKDHSKPRSQYVSHMREERCGGSQSRTLGLKHKHKQILINIAGLAPATADRVSNLVVHKMDDLLD